MSLPIAAIGTAFTAAGGAAAGGITAGGLLATQIIGGVVAGIGTGLMKKQEMKDEERREREEEERAQQSYEGAGQAMRFWETDDPEGEAATGANEFERADAQSNQHLAVGQREQPKKAGQKFLKRKPATSSRFRYDKSAGQIVPA